MGGLQQWAGVTSHEDSLEASSFSEREAVQGGHAELYYRFLAYPVLYVHKASTINRLFTENELEGGVFADRKASTMATGGFWL